MLRRQFVRRGAYGLRMEVVFPVAFGVIAALATIGMFALARVALPGLREGWAGRRESARAMRRPVPRTAPAAGYTSPRPRRPLVPVMDPAIRATPVRSPEQIHWSMAVRRANAAVDGAGTVGGNGVGGGAAAAGMDVEGHGVGVAALEDKLDANLSDYPVVEAQRAYWQTNGSTDCPRCPSSRRRGATFCLRCGRWLPGNADAESIAAAPAADVPVSVMPGDAQLRVVGESHNQNTLRSITGSGSQQARVATTAVLFPEEDNQYDANAISVWIQGKKVGHLSREDAAAMRAGLLDLQTRVGGYVAVPGQIISGGPVGTLGVFLRFNPADFRLETPARPASRPAEGSGVRTGFGLALSRDSGVDRYELDWVATMPDDPAAAVSMLENRLETEAQPVGRHFLFAQFESHLYSMRAETGALERFDEMCERHHAEMGVIAPALVEVFGGIPLLEVYKQAVIRHQKTHHWSQAVEWAERGIATYADHALKAADVEDLRVRLNKSRAKLEQAATPRQPRAPRAKATDESPPAIETLVCQNCGRSWERQRVRGRKPHYCPDCTVTAGSP
jgi:HIRAN domain